VYTWEYTLCKWNVVVYCVNCMELIAPRESLWCQWWCKVLFTVYLLILLLIGWNRVYLEAKAMTIWEYGRLLCHHLSKSHRNFNGTEKLELWDVCSMELMNWHEPCVCVPHNFDNLVKILELRVFFVMQSKLAYRAVWRFLIRK